MPPRVAELPSVHLKARSNSCLLFPDARQMGPEYRNCLHFGRTI
jgi:hypothetical protein